jgi:hypothetical protein
MSPASRSCPALLASAALLVVPAIASADPAPATPTSSSAFERPHLGVEGSLGLWTPLGSAGATFIASPIPELSFEAGVGAALSGPQVSGMARVHPLRGPVQLSVAGGLSTGRYEEPGFFSATHTWERAVWANGEISLDLRIDDQLMLRFFGGIGRIVSDNDACVASGSSGGDTPDDYGPTCSDPGRELPFGGIALRSAFTIGG